MLTKIHNKSLIAAAMLLTLSTAAVPAFAQTNKPPANKSAIAAKAPATKSDAMKLSQDGFKAMHAVREARIAIFNGNPQAARDALDRARTALDAATDEAPLYVMDIKTGVKGKIVSDDKLVEKVDTIPIDGQVVLVDSFVDKPERKAHIDKANEHIAKGQGKETADELRLAEVDASFTRVLMPLKSTAKHVAQANVLISEAKYYEANLALKAAEDSLRTDTVMLSESPKPATASKGG